MKPKTDEIAEEIRKGIHYNCSCEDCEKSRLLLDHLVGIDLALEDKEEVIILAKAERRHWEQREQELLKQKGMLTRAQAKRLVEAKAEEIFEDIEILPTMMLGIRDNNLWRRKLNDEINELKQKHTK